jgi:DNA-binding NarL/FixJ family response regulator
MEYSETAAVLVVLSDNQGNSLENNEIRPSATVFLPRHVAAYKIGRAVLATVAANPDVKSTTRTDLRPAGGRILTVRELEVLELAGRGEPSKAIAAALGIRERTVKFHLSAAMRKLGTRSRTEAVMAAVRAGQLAL